MKRVLSMLLVCALLLSIPMMPLPAEAATAEVNITDPTSQCPCCGVPMDQLEWIPFDASVGSTPPAGHYYLAADYNQTSVKSIMAWDKVVLDLRGHKWSSYATSVMPSASSYRMMTISGYFYLMDTAGGGVVEAQMKENYGGAFLMDENEHAEPMFHMLSGTIRPRHGEEAAISGGLIYAYESGIFKMTGGVIENGAAVTGEGGAILGGANSQILIHGGMIRNCKAKTNGGAIKSIGIVEIKNASIIGCSAENDGGAVYVTKRLTMENATISGNISNHWGGGIAAAGATVTAEDTLFWGNVANYSTSYYNGGGNLYAASKAVVTLTDCTLKDGYSANQGGNIFVTGATMNLVNTTLSGGVAKTGDNMRAYNSTTTIEGGNIKGDITIEKGSLTLKGAAKIGVNGAGLVLYNAPAVTASALTEGAEIYVQHSTSGGTVAAAGANIAYFKGAFRSVLSGGGSDPIIATTAADGATAGYCPHCNTQVAWSVFSKDNLTTGHYYLKADTTTSFTVPADADMVLDRNGKILTGASGYRVFTILGELAIVDSGVGTYDGDDKTPYDGRTDTATQWNGGVIKGSGATGNNGGVVHNNGTFKLYGGTLRYVKNANYVMERGGAVYNFSSGTMYMYGGLLDGSAYNNTNATGSCLDKDLADQTKSRPEGLGGAFHAAGGSKFYMTAGRMVGGTAYGGGTAGFDGNVTVEITGGTFHGGKSTYNDEEKYEYGGGNLFFGGAADNGSVQVSNIIVTGGEAAKCGGNIYFGRYKTNSFNNILVIGGKSTAAKGYGGNASILAAGALSVANSTFLGGNAYCGGNIQVSNTSANVTFDTCYLYNGVTPGPAGSNGGNMIVSYGSVTIKGGEIASGRAGTSSGGVGGNICCGASGTVITQKNEAGEVPCILGGTAKYGGNFSVMGKVTLTDAKVGGGATLSGAGRDIQLSGDNAKLTVGSGLTGNVSVWPKEGKELTYGQVIGATVATTLSDDVNITLESVSGTPKAVAKDGVLKVAGVQVVDSEGNAQWCADFAEAAELDGYVKLYTDMDVTLTKDTFVDLNGHKVTVSGVGNLLGMDTTGDNYAQPAGVATFTEGANTVQDKALFRAPNGKMYVALAGENGVSFHRLGADLLSVTINVTKNGICFKGTFGADSVLKDMIATYGIAVSVENMPDATFDNALKVEFAGETMANNEEVSSLTVVNILQTQLSETENMARGMQNIYASSFVTLKDGQTIYMGDNAETNEDDVVWSLKDVLVRLNDLIENDPTNFRRYTNTMREYYMDWQNCINQWLGANNSFVTPEKDDVIDILMIGSSFCTYYVQEMWQIANAAGIKVRVCNVYYSGCPLSKYYTDWVNGDAAYQFYETTGPERKSFAGSKTLEWCLAQGEWDVISMQEYTGNIRKESAEEHLETTDLYTSTLFPYITSQFPKAKFYFHQTWSFQQGYNRSGYVVDSPKKQAEDAQKQKEFALGLLKKYGDPTTSGEAGSEFQVMDGRVPTGEAWQLVREGWSPEGVEYKGYDNLCMRTGTANNAGDNYHDGDLGGGQYLNALVWILQVMKDRGVNLTKDDIKWTPTNSTYGYNLATGLNFEQLKDCAFETVFGNGWTYDAAKYKN